MIKLKILVDNCVDQPDVQGELGFSIYIEYDGFKVLFDVGQSDLFARNAELFQIDISSIDALVVSHGHYDHTGGLPRFLELNKKAKVYIKGGLEFDKYNACGKYIGIPTNVSMSSNRLVNVTEKLELAQGLYIMPSINLYDKSDTHFDHLFVSNELYDTRADQFFDEQYLALVHNGKMSIINGCAHRGIVNIIRSALVEFSMPIQLLVGGFHTRHCNEDFISQLAHNLNQFSIDKIVTCHCTGMDQFAQLQRSCKTKVEYGFVGKSIIIE